jgi:pyruvate/2-oxoglutarate dehydrogenase complex dihydrolipoamide acyltransferase (E2) component
MPWSRPNWKTCPFLRIEDKDKNTITLGGTVHSEEAKAKAGDVAKAAANTRIIANEISVPPVGSESEARGEMTRLRPTIRQLWLQAVWINSKFGLKRTMAH